MGEERRGRRLLLGSECQRDFLEKSSWDERKGRMSTIKTGLYDYGLEAYGHNTY
jgi:hypothetical protein